jgi:predicted amidohydrolase
VYAGFGLFENALPIESRILPDLFLNIEKVTNAFRSNALLSYQEGTIMAYNPAVVLPGMHNDAAGLIYTVQIQILAHNNRIIGIFKKCHSFDSYQGTWE